MLIPPAKLYPISEFDLIFDPKKYFEHYYGAKRPDEFEKESWPFLIKTLLEIFGGEKKRRSNKRMLQIGMASSGILLPVLTEQYFDEFHLADSCEKVRREIDGFLNDNHSDCFDWKFILEEINRRTNITARTLDSVKRKIKRILDFDVIGDAWVNNGWPSSPVVDRIPYDVVATLFHLESRVENLPSYFEAVKNAADHLKSDADGGGGFYLQGGMLNQSYYDAGDNKYLLSLPVSKQQILDSLDSAGIEVLSWNDFEVPYCNASRTSTSPGASMYLCHGVKRS